MSKFRKVNKTDLWAWDIPSDSEILQFGSKDFEVNCIYFINDDGEKETAVYLDFDSETADCTWYYKLGDFRKNCENLVDKGLK